MTKLGKIFTAIMMVLSILFFTLSVLVNATHVNYTELLNDPTTGLKAVAQRQQAQITALTEQIQKQKEAIATELASRRAALAALQVQMEQMDFQVDQLEKALLVQQGEMNQLAATEKANEEEMIARGKQNDETRNEMQQARTQRDELFQKFRTAYGDWLRLQGDYRTLESQYNQITGAPTSEEAPSDAR